MICHRVNLYQVNIYRFCNCPTLISAFAGFEPSRTWHDLLHVNLATLPLVRAPSSNMLGKMC